MSDAAEITGKELASFTHTVERGKIREMALAIGDDNPLYSDPEYAGEQGYRDIIAPPTFGICIDLWSGLDFISLCRRLQLNLVKVLHGEQEYCYHGEIYPGDELKATCLLKNITDKGKMRVISLETRYYRTNELVLVARTTIIERK
ncbi:MaoC family dehydratase N-terminal domain-containing protein [Desulfotomaculum copahuensis]|uniref:FAS1-like dehydratase domain-containing protein n=1 Tax=Desulfotomaculum copahuensis TaxID=1838280 RepID=A0A1B7LDF7_9FIRM|nr:MaoC family dehydratase N-terminal domain-containing protein [Desulfotomaculum copahuensis]OAT81129.1 hypothetical protein A6M21_12035 [Desulfotomaculum copahuensis]